MDRKTGKIAVDAAPTGQRGATEELANAVAFLTSDEASFVTGAL